MLSCDTPNCLRFKGNGNDCAEYEVDCTTDSLIDLDRAKALALIAQCKAGNTVKLAREYQSVDGDSTNDASTSWTICPASGSHSYESEKNGPSRVYMGVTLTYTNGDTLSIQERNANDPASVFKVVVGASNASTLVNPVGGRCDTDADCSGDNVCTHPNGDASDKTCSVAVSPRFFFSTA